jgi:hypothetical protein
MSAPFPGMDPFIESQRFDDFHTAFLVTIRELLVPVVRPRYTVEVERFVFVSGDEDVEHLFEPDVLLAETETSTAAATAASPVATLQPRIMAVPQTDEDGQAFLTIRTTDDRNVITVIELLSPTNKEKSGGMQQYLAKRATYLRTLTNIVEIDLLRGGTRLPTHEPLEDGDYFTFVIRHGDRSHVEVYGWKLPDRLPVIPVPLREDDPDVGLDLQEAFDRAYDRSGYDYAINYKRPVTPPLPEDVQRWVEERLTEGTSM